MRVTYVANRLNTSAGGVDLSLSLMARSVAERGHDVRVVTANTDEDNEFPADAPYEVVEHPVEYASRAKLATELYGILQEFEADTDIYHVFEPAFISVAGLYRRRGGEAAVVGRLNAYTLFCSNLARMDGKCYENCTIRDKFVHDDRPIGQKLLRMPQYVSRTHVESRLLNGVDETLIDVVPNFYNPDFSINVGDAQRAATTAGVEATNSGEDGEATVSEDASAEGTSESDQIRLLFVGRLTEIKGVDVLVEAFGSLDQDDTVLDLVGDGDLRDALEAQVARTEVADRVTFHGWVDHDDLPRYYDAADVFVHPGRLPEPFGRTLLEALQFDCPLVVSDIGAPPWVAGDAGVTFARNDPEALADVLAGLLDDPARRESLQRQCDARLEQFAPAHVLDEILRRYEEITEDAMGT